MSVVSATAQTSRRLLHDLELERELFTSKNGRQVKFPKLSCESKCWPPLIEVDENFNPQRAPKVSEADVRFQWPQFGFGVKRKWRSLRHEAGERITIEMIAMGWVGRPIRICVMRCNDMQPAARLRNAMQLDHKRKHIRHMLDDMSTDDLVELTVNEWIGKDTKVVYDVGVAPRI